jgi:hypothetical protein
VVIYLTLDSWNDGSDTPTPGPGPSPGPDKPVYGYNPYAVDNETVQVDFGEYSGQLFISKKSSEEFENFLANQEPGSHQPF